MSLVVRLFDTLALDAWKNPFSSIFGTAVGGADAWLASDTAAFAETHIETRETAGAYVFSARLPAGVTKEEIRVEVEEEGHVLVIAGERSVRCVRREKSRSDAAAGRHVVESSCATFFGRFCLPEDAVVGQVRAAMGDGGELTVTVPRVGAPAAVAAPEPALAIEVQVQASPC